MFYHLGGSGTGIQNNFSINSTGTLRNLNNIARQKLKFPLLLKDTVRAIARFGGSLQKKTPTPSHIQTSVHIFPLTIVSKHTRTNLKFDKEQALEG